MLENFIEERAHTSSDTKMLLSELRHWCERYQCGLAEISDLDSFVGSLTPQSPGAEETWPDVTGLTYIMERLERAVLHTAVTRCADTSVFHVVRSLSGAIRRTYSPPAAGHDELLGLEELATTLVTTPLQIRLLYNSLNADCCKHEVGKAEVVELGEYLSDLESSRFLRQPISAAQSEIFPAIRAKLKRAIFDSQSKVSGNSIHELCNATLSSIERVYGIISIDV